MHLGRLPSIDPFARTILIAGFPNVGKSSFINNISNANVEVQPFPFTTQALYVGHTDYSNVRWQIIDSPGILDHELESRNTIEMQSITAMAHLKACILFFIDVSETCGYSLEKQMTLFEGIKPLFVNKPHLLILTKTDLKKVENLEPEQKTCLEEFIKRNEIEYVELSNQEGDSVFDVKKKACDILLKYRMSNEEKNIAKNAGLKREEDYLRGVKIFEPVKTRDDKERPSTIPADILAGNKHVLGRPNMKQMQEAHGGAGVFEFPLQEHFCLENQDWKYDVIPEIIDGKNIFDFVDPEIEEKLRLLEEEEDALLAEEGLKMESDTEGTELNPEQAEAYKDFKAKVGEIRVESRQNRNLRVTPKPTAESLRSKLVKKGLEAKKIVDQVQAAQKVRGRKTLKHMLEGELEGKATGEDGMVTIIFSKHK